MRDFTLDQLLDAYSTALQEYRFAHMASRLSEVERRQKQGKATMEAVKAELKRRIGGKRTRHEEQAF